MCNVIKSLSTIVGSKASYNYLIQTVKKIPIYSRDCNIQLAQLHTTSIIPLANFAVTKRLRHAYEILVAIIDAGIDVYEPFIIEQYRNVRLVFPPLVEITNSNAYLIDGTHRILAAINKGLHYIQVIRVTSAYLPPLPCEPTNWTSIKVTPEQKPLDDILKPLNLKFYRPVTSFFNSSQFNFNSISELINYYESRR